MSMAELADKILDLVGGKGNISYLTNCVTRLRFNLKDRSTVDLQAIEQLPHVLGAQFQGEQLQVILGAKVAKVAAELGKKVDLSGGAGSETKTKLTLGAVVETLAAILAATLPAIIAGGMLKGFIFLFTNYNWVSPESDTILILNLIADCMFYFFPFLVAVSAAKKFKTNEYMALAVAGALMYPTLVGAIGERSSFLFLGFLPLAVVKYSGSVVPIILSVLLLKYVYDFFNKTIPDMVTIIFSPLLTLLVTIPLSLAALAPLGYYIGEYIAVGITFLIDLSPFISGFVVGVTRPLLVLTGMHHAINPIGQQQLLSLGYSQIGPMSLMSTMAQATAALGAYIFIKNKKDKQIALSATVSGYIGITEPALYGILVKYKEAMIAACLGGGLGAAIASSMGAKAFGFVMPGIFSIPAYMGDGFPGVVTGMIVSIGTTFGLMFIFKNKMNARNAHVFDAPTIGEATDTLLTAKSFSIFSPATGELVKLSDVNDVTFAHEAVGKGIAIIPSNGEIVAPFDGTVSALFKSQHAIGITSKTGVEVLIHIGIDTVNLQGDGFKVLVKDGETIQKGQAIIEFNLPQILEKGYDPTIMIVVTNSANYLNVLPFEESGKIFIEEQLLSVIK